MQSVSTALQTILDSDSRNLSDVYEIYAADYLPGDEFDPAVAIARYAHIDLTWNGLAYERQAISRGAVSRFIGSTINNTNLTFSNVDRSLASFILNNDIEGMWCVVRRVSRTVTNSSLVLFVGKFDQPSDVDKGTCSISVKQFIGSVDYELPYRIFRADDPEGRLPTDPLFEGFRFIPTSGTFEYTALEERRVFFGLFKRTKKVAHSAQWSSFSGTPLGDPIPEVVGGRCQVQGIPILYYDGGTFVASAMVACNGKVHAIEDIRNQTRGFSTPHNISIHLGEPGNTGTQIAGTQFPDAGFFSNTAYIQSSVTGSSPETVDSAPTITMVVLAEVDLPDEDGEFTEDGFSDNPIYVTRNFLTKAKFLNVPAALIDDESNASEVLWCDAPLIDDANTDRVFLPTEAAVLANDGIIRRWQSTGGINPYAFRHQLGIDPDLHILREPEYEDWDGLEPPTITTVRVLRKRWTVNATLTDKVRALDYLHKTLLAAFRGYLLTGANGKIKIKVEKPADSVLIRSTVSIGATEIAVEDVEPWKLSLQGLIGIGIGLPTCEVREVTDYRYSTAGNSITLTATGGVTASGATFSGGDGADVPSTATLTVTSDSGTKTVTIDGVQVQYATIGDDTTGTVGGMLAAGINSNPTLNRYIKATWNPATPTVVSLQAKLGFLQFSTPLAFGHAIAEEVIRGMASFSDRALVQANCVRANIRKDSFKWPLGGREKTINQVKGKFHDSRNDFAETPYELNNTPHQLKVRKILPEEIDLSAVDNVHQASRLAKGRYAEVCGLYYPDLFDEPLKGSTFFSWGASARGKSLLLEEGDVVFVTESSGGFFCLPVRIEDMKIPQKGGPDFTSRLYATAMYAEEVLEQIVPLPTSLSNPLAIESPVFDSVDDGVPVVTVAPTVTQVDFQEQWSVYYPNPDSKGFSLVDSEVQVRRASDSLVLLTRPNGRSNNIVITQYAFDCKIRYRWRNQYRESGSTGWSSWSPDTNAFKIGSATPNDPESELPIFDQDPGDIFNPHNREVLF